MSPKSPATSAWNDVKYSLPLVKQAEKTVGVIKRIIALNCEDPALVYVEAAVSSALQAWYSVIEPDEKEVYHKVVGKSFVCSIKQAIGEAHEATGENPGNTTRFLFKFGEVFDLAVWYFFLGDVFADGVLNYTSAVYKQSECVNKNNPNYGSGGLFAASLHGDGVYLAADFQYAPGSNFSPVSPTHIFISPGGSGMIAASLQFKRGEAPVGTSSRIRDFTTNAIHDQDSNAMPDGTSKRPNHVWWKGGNGTDEGKIIGCEWAWSGGGIGGQAFGDSDRAHCSMFAT